MATYLYETIPADPSAAPERFEIQQSMKDDALIRHPDTGVPVRRIVTGGFAPIGVNRWRNRKIAGSAPSGVCSHNGTGPCCG
jgi:hypothetical protein